MSTLESMSRELRAMTRELRDLQQQQIHQGLRAMIDETRTLTREATMHLKHAYLNALTRRRPAVHKSLQPYNGISVNPLTPPESERFYNWMHRRLAAR